MFGNRTYTKSHAELIVFMTPRVVYDNQSSDGGKRGVEGPAAEGGAADHPSPPAFSEPLPLIP
ncbi:MAG: hypothetical protein IT165_15335 [Bryobacterales bacterium]|nr:hypothetical protein [Bryobacterales bacterium]